MAQTKFSKVQVDLSATKLSDLAATTSAELAATISDETGSGALVFGTAPTITLGNGTGLPLSTGISGFGTGIATALAVNTGSAGAPVLFNGALGTPSSGTLTNATGLPIAGLVASTATAIGVGSVELGHASDTTLSRASAGDVNIEGNIIYRAGGTDVPVADGGTGRSTSTTAYGIIAAGTTATGAHQTLATGTSGQILKSNGNAALATFQTGAPGDVALGNVTNDAQIKSADFPSSSVDSEIALFSSTTGKVIKRATTTGILKGTSGVLSAATAGTDYEVPITFSTGLTRSTNTVTVNTTQNIAKLSNLTSNGFVKTSGGDGTLSVDTASYQPLDSDLTTIAGLTATTDSFLQSKASAWTTRTPTQVTADLIAFVGDAGSGGTKGLVPAPTTGDATKFLKGDGTWGTPSGSGTVTSVSVTSANGFAGSVATSTTTPAITISTSITGVLKGNGTAISAATAGTDYTSPSSTETVTNKDLTGTSNTHKKVTTTASSGTPTPTGDSDFNHFTVTALAAGATFAAPSGTPKDGNSLVIRIKDNGSAQTLAFNAIYRAIGVTLPTTTVLSKTLYLGMTYNSADSKWDVTAVAQQA